MSLADDHIDDGDIGPLWAKHFSKIGEDAGSKTIVLALVYIIEDTRRARLVVTGPTAFSRNSDARPFPRTSFGKSKARRRGDRPDSISL
jgi:hypothetical protein